MPPKIAWNVPGGLRSPAIGVAFSGERAPGGGTVGAFAYELARDATATGARIGAGIRTRLAWGERMFGAGTSLRGAARGAVRGISLVVCLSNG